MKDLATAFASAKAMPLTRQPLPIIILLTNTGLCSSRHRRPSSYSHGTNMFRTGLIGTRVTPTTGTEATIATEIINVVAGAE